MCGDFNDVLSQDEKWGFRPASMSRIRDFKNCISSCGLVDLGYVGQKYTWFNKRENGHVVFQRLDRFLGNAELLNTFPHVVVTHLPRIKSYHNPTFFSSKPSNHSFRPRPFRCERMWINQPDFIKLVNLFWHENQHRPLAESLELFKEQALLWNKNDFGNLFQRKKRIFARLDGINRAFFNGPNLFLESLQSSLSIELQHVLALEEEFWASKSHVEWLNLGDSNTTFFHSSVISRRRSNRILSLKNSVGEWIDDDNGIVNHICDYFKALFSSSSTSSFPLPISHNLTYSDILSSISGIPNVEEIKHGLFDLKPHKAAGYDGFQPAFFQKNWNCLSASIVHDITFAFQHQIVPSGWNNTLICLIPKCNNPSEIKSFRPISLCTTSYKIISKILVHRLKPVLPSLISPNQGAFVPLRKVTDHVVIAQEAVHNMKHQKKGKFGWLVVKLDLEKAYDKLN